MKPLVSGAATTTDAGDVGDRIDDRGVHALGRQTLSQATGARSVAPEGHHRHLLGRQRAEVGGEPLGVPGHRVEAAHGRAAGTRGPRAPSAGPGRGASLRSSSRSKPTCRRGPGPRPRPRPRPGRRQCLGQGRLLVEQLDAHGRGSAAARPGPPRPAPAGRAGRRSSGTSSPASTPCRRTARPRRSGAATTSAQGEPPAAAPALAPAASSGTELPAARTATTALDARRSMR